MSKLPDDIVADILLRLPVKSLSRFRSVCKLWLSIISHPHFAAAHHLTRHPNRRSKLFLNASSLYYTLTHNVDELMPLQIPLKFPNRPSSIVGSCNGLVCLRNSPNSIYIFNPTTRQCRELPRPGDFPQGFDFYGFGYDSSTDDYKVIKAVAGKKSSKSVVRVYSLRNDSWKTVEDEFPYRIHAQRPGVYVCSANALHWVAFDLYQGYLIASFDLASEKFGTVPLPAFGDGDKYSMFNVGVLGGCLCVLRVENRYEPHAVLWQLCDYRVKESWTKLFANLKSEWLSCSLLFLIDAEENGKVLVHKDSKMLAWYDHGEAKFKDVVIRVLGNVDWFQVILYEESLVSPYAYV